MRTLCTALLAMLALMGAGLAADIDDVTGKQLESVMETEDFLAVYWYTKNCKTCERVLTVLERVSNEVAEAGVTIVKVNDKKAAKAQAIRNFPALTFFKGGDAVQYEGDLMNSESILDFLASPGYTDMTDKIEDVTASQLEALVHQKTYVAVFFFTGNRESSSVLAGLETVDEDANKLGVSFVKINDLELVAEYNLGNLPALVYYRHTIPILYQGDLGNSGDVLEWLIQNRHSGDGEDIIEEVDSNTVQTMVQAVENIAVLFYDAKSRKVDQLMENLEMIDDDCDTRGIHFVKISEAGGGAKFGIDTLPTLVFFRSNVPNIFDGELLDGSAVLQWLLTHLESDEIEEVTSPMLGKLVKDSRHLVVLFYKKGEKEMSDALEALETIDDDFDRLSVGMVKVHEPEAAAEWGITTSSAIVYFENGIPFIYTGNVKDEREVLRWVKQQFEGDEIEEVNPKMLEKIVKSEVGSKEQFGAHADAAVLFYKRGDPFSNKVLKMLENIDDECDTYGIIFVKVAEENKAAVASEMGIIDLPALVYFEDKIPHLYDGDLRSQDDVLNWLVTQMETDEIEEVTDAMLDKLIETNPYVTAIFYDKGDKTSIKALAALETIDDDLDAHNIAMLKMSDTSEARNYGVKEFPSIIMFKNKIPELYPGDTTNEGKVLEWIYKLAEVSSSSGSGGAFGIGAASAAEIEAPTPHVFKPKAEKPPPKVEKPPPKVEKPPPKVEKPLPVVEKPPPLENEPPKPVKLKKEESSEPTKELKPKKDTKPKEAPEPVKVDEPANTSEEVVNEEPEAGDEGSDNIADALKNGNNVVAFFSDNGGYERRKNGTSSERNEGFFSWIGLIRHEMGVVGLEGMEEMDEVGQQGLEEQVDWCILLPCAAAKPSHKKSLNIDKLQAVPLYKPEGKKKQTSGGWMGWIFRSSEQQEETQVEEIQEDTLEEDDQAENDEEGEGEGEEEEEEEIVEDEDESTIIAEDEDESDDVDRTWYEVTLLPSNEGESWYEVDLFGDDTDEEDDDKTFCKFCNKVISTFTINWLGDSDSNTRPWYQVNLFSQPGDDIAQDDDDDEDDGFGEDTTKKAFCSMCNQAISVFSVNWLGDSEESGPSWYKVDLLPPQEGDGPSWYEVDLLGDDGLAPTWYHVNLFGSLVSADGDDQSEIDDTDEDQEDDMINNLDGIDSIDNDEDEENGEGVDETEKIVDDDAEEDEDISINEQDEGDDGKEIDGIDEVDEEVSQEELVEVAEEESEDVAEEPEEVDKEEPEEVVEEEAEEVVEEEAEEDAEEDTEEVVEDEPVDANEDPEDTEEIISSTDDDDEEEEATEEKATEEEEGEEITDNASNDEIESEDEEPTVEEGEEENETFGEWLFGSDDEEPKVIQEEIVVSKKHEINKADIEHILNEKPELLEELTQYLLGKLKTKDLEDEDDIVEENYEQDDLVDSDIAPEESIEEDVNEIEEELEEEPQPEQEASSIDEDIAPSEEISGPAELIKTSKSSLIIFFYESLDKISKKIISGIVKVEGHFSGKDIKFLTVDANDMPEMNLPTVPSLVYFKNGQPTVYEENLMNEDAIKAWVEMELQSNQDVIEDLSTEQVHGLMEKEEYVMVYIYAPDCEACDEAIKQLEEIDDDAEAVGVKFVKTEDADFAEEYGISEFPAIIYFEHEQPSIYDGDAGEETELLTWLLYQMKEDTIENINRELMTKMIEDFEFLAVFFYTADNVESGKVLRHLELIDDEASQYGVRLVKIDDALMSKKYGHREPPGLGYFRKGNYIKFDGDLLDDEEMLDWLTDPNTMEISDQIEKVNKKMFEKLISRNEFLAVMFYSETDCKQCDSVLEELENIDDDAEASGIPIVKLEDKTLAKNIGVFALPAIVFFRNFGEEPTIYAGDLKREDSILEWLLIQKDPSNEAIEEMDGEALRKAIDKSEAVAVFVYTQDGCETCLPILQALENIDDDTDRQKISMVKTIDAAFAEEVGIEKFPGLVFFKDGVPNLYEGDLLLEEEVLDWLIEMKVESHIELITRPMLESMVEEIQYLAVFFYKLNCRTCDQVIVELENIDDDCDVYGIQMVKLKDPQLAKRYGIKTFPALVYFRNGNPLTYDGDLKNEESVLEWLIDDDNRELEDEIEAVNYRMLDKLLETSPFMAVFFYDDECIECEAILEQLENIDDEADIYGIDFVKNNDPHAAKQYNIYNTPALVYFRKMTPIVYDGDLMDDERILEWLTSQDVFEIKDEIEEVNRKMLEKLLDENEFVAVYFYEDDCEECNEVLEGLERIDDETDALDITFVKINDPRYAKKYGVNKLPALVYFRRKFPSIYRDSLLGEAEVLDWLTTNRYKQMELGVFMYAIIALAVTFMFYTAFLMFGLKPREPEKKKEE